MRKIAFVSMGDISILRRLTLMSIYVSKSFVYPDATTKGYGMKNINRNNGQLNEFCDEI